MTTASQAHGYGRSQRGNGASRPQHSLYDDMLAIAQTLLRGRREAGAGKIESLAAATRDFAAKMPEMPNVKSYASAAAGRLEDLSDYVSETDFDRILSDTAAFARRNPLVTLGVTIAAGWWAARMFHASHDGGRAQRAASPRGRAKRVAPKRAKSKARPKAA